MSCKATTPDQPIAYIERTRAYYLALGYDTPYRWAHNQTVPFQPLERPLEEARIALITTAAPYRPEYGDQGPGAAYNGRAKFFSPYRLAIANKPDVRISHVAYDRTHTSAQDPGTWFPLAALKRARQNKRIGSLCDHIFGAPTNRSQRSTLENDAPALLQMVREDEADAAVLVPNCPVCHQSVTLIARHLEANGIAAVIMGCARDIVERAGPARFVFSDFPLGNSAGRPGDPASQDLTLELALDLLEQAKAPATTLTSPLVWPGPADWKLDYSNPARLSQGELAQRRAAFEAAKLVSRDRKTSAAEKKNQTPRLRPPGQAL